MTDAHSEVGMNFKIHVTTAGSDKPVTRAAN